MAVMNSRPRRSPSAAALTIAIALSGAAPALSQTVVDPTTAEFQPSPDHDVTTPDGTAWVTSYLLQIFPSGSSTPAYSIDMGKPAPGTDGVIRFEFASRLTTPLVPGIVYQARVSAVGPGGSGISTVSNPFSSSVVCSPLLSGSSASFGSGASKGSVTVTVAAGCPWGAGTTDTWLSITSGSTGNGPGAVSFTVAANTSTTARVGTITIAGQTFTVNQAGACQFTLKPATVTVAAPGLATSLTVDTGPACTWSASNMPAWVSMPPGVRTGPGTLSYTVAANLGAARTATLTIAGQPFVINQNATSVLPPGNLRIIRSAPQ